MEINTYLNFNGNCEEAFKFYEKVLGGQVLMKMTAEESPVAEHFPPGWGKKIMHIRMKIGGQLLMGSDSPPEYSSTPAGFAVSIVVDTPEEADRIFNALAEGGEIGMPIEETFWAHRFGMTKDRFGVPWMVNCEKS